MDNITDNSKYGWIGLYRSIKNHWLFPSNRAFTKFEAWIYILLSVNYEDKKVFSGADLQICKKGQMITSQMELMKKFMWSKSKLIRYLKNLEDDQMIVVKTDSKKTTIEVLNYSNYQDFQQIAELKKDHKKTVEKLQKDYEKTINDLSKRLQKDTNNKGNKENKDNKENKEIKKSDFVILNNDFEEARKIYPGTKRGYEIEYKNFVSQCKTNNLNIDETIKKLLPAIEDQIYSKKINRENGAFVPSWKNFKTWINQMCWTEEIGVIEISKNKLSANDEKRKIFIQNSMK